MIKKVALLLIILSATGLIYLILYTTEPADKDISYLQLNANLKQTLSNKTLDRAIYKRKDKIEKCSKKRNIEGDLLIEMQIFNNGTHQTQILHSTIKHPGFIKCLQNLLNQILFPSFSGPTITRVYTLKFSKKSLQ